MTRGSKKRLHTEIPTVPVIATVWVWLQGRQYNHTHGLYLHSTMLYTTSQKPLSHFAIPQSQELAIEQIIDVIDHIILGSSNQAREHPHYSISLINIPLTFFKHISLHR
jgi:hypothetical protein